MQKKILKTKKRFLDLLPDVFTAKDIEKINEENRIYKSKDPRRHAESVFKCGYLKKEYKNLPTGGKYCVYTKI